MNAMIVDRVYSLMLVTDNNKSTRIYEPPHRKP